MVLPVDIVGKKMNAILHITKLNWKAMLCQRIEFGIRSGGCSCANMHVPPMIDFAFYNLMCASMIRNQIEIFAEKCSILIKLGAALNYIKRTISIHPSMTYFLHWK